MEKSQNQSIEKSFFRVFLGGMAWSSGASFLIKVAGLLYTFFLLRYLGLKEYGTYQIVLSAYGLLGIFFLPGIEDVVVARASAMLGERKGGEASSLGAGYAVMLILCTVFVFLLGAFLSVVAMRRGMFGVDVIRYFDLLLLLLFLLPLERIILFDSGIHHDFARQNGYSLVREGVRLITGIVAVVSFNDKILWLILTTIFSYLIAIFAFGSNILRKYLHVQEKKSGFHEVIALVKKQGPWLITQRVMRQLEKNCRPFFVQFFLGREAVGLFSLADKLLTHVMTLLPASTVLVPLLARIRNEKQRVRRIFTLGIKYSIPLYSVYTVANYICLPILFKYAFPTYATALPLFNVLLLYIPMTGVAFLLTALFVSLQEQKNMAIISIGRSVLTVMIAPICILVFGIKGIVYEYIITLYLFLAARYILLRYIDPELGVDIREILHWDSSDSARCRLALSKLAHFVIRG